MPKTILREVLFSVSLNDSDRNLSVKITTSVKVFSKTGKKSDFPDLKRHIISLSKINFIFIAFFFSLFLGPKGSKTTKFLRSSNQEHPGTWEDVILTKPGGILQIPRHSYKTTMRWGRNVHYDERSLWMILGQAATLAYGIIFHLLSLKNRLWSNPWSEAFSIQKLNVRFVDKLCTFSTKEIIYYVKWKVKSLSNSFGVWNNVCRVFS